MALMKLQDLKPGMILENPVYDFQDMLLLKEGVELTEKNLKMMKSWGVTRARVEGEYGDQSLLGSDSESDVKNKIEEEIKEQFTGVSDDEVMQEIMKAAAKVIERRMLG